MKEVEARIRDITDLWDEDKTLLRAYDPNLPIDWSTSIPTNGDALQIMQIVNGLWQNPPNPIELNETTLGQILEWLVPELEGTWGAKFERPPDVEIVSEDDYLPRLQESQRRLIDRIGYGDVIQSPPGMAFLPDESKIITTPNYVVRKPRGNHTKNMLSSDFDILTFPWDRPFLETVLCEELSHLMFRQLRNETGNGYVSFAKAVSKYSVAEISMLNEFMAHYVQGNLTKTKHPQWSLYTIRDQISLVWSERESMASYLAVEALSADRDLARVAMIDGARPVSPEKVYVLFDHFHPKAKEKKERFDRLLRK